MDTSSGVGFPLSLLEFGGKFLGILGELDQLSVVHAAQNVDQWMKSNDKVLKSEVYYEV